MKKFVLVVLITFNLVCLAQEIKISHNLPSSLKKGQSFDWELIINKGTVGGFAKIQIDIPSGFSVEELDLNGGTFTFESDRAKIVWVAMPSPESFKFKLRLRVPTNTFSSYMITGKFHYLQNNVKKEYAITPHEIQINETGSTSDSHVHTDATPVNTVSAPINNVAEPVKETVKVETEIVKSETVPTPKTTEEAVNEVKVADHPSETPKVVVIPTSETEKSAVVKPPVVENTAPPVKEIKIPETQPVVAAETKVAAAAIPGLTFKVQVGAYSANPGKSKFPGIQVDIKQEDGKFKVYTGNFNTHEEAVQYKNSLSSKGINGFVVRFQNGVRIK